MGIVVDFKEKDILFIDDKKFEVIDSGSNLYIYGTNEYDYREETTVIRWFLIDDSNEWYRLDLPLNKDPNLTKLYKLAEKAKIIEELKFTKIRKD